MIIRLILSTETLLPKRRLHGDVIKERLPIVCGSPLHRARGETAFEKARQRGGAYARR
jgi:hypothetical protein